MSSDKNRQKDSDIFRQAVGTVQPVNQDPRYTPENKPLDQLLKERLKNTEYALNLTEQYAEEPSFLDLEPIDELDSSMSRLFIRPGVKHRTMKQLRCGRIPIQGSLDLHGLTAIQAKNKLNTFILNSIASNHRAVIVIHGKGMRSNKGAPILKTRVNAWLRKHDNVLGFCSAAAHHGGSGALYVLLKLDAS